MGLILMICYVAVGLALRELRIIRVARGQGIHPFELRQWEKDDVDGWEFPALITITFLWAIPLMVAYS